MPTLRTEISDLRVDPPGTEITDRTRAYVNIEAHLRIYIGDRVFLDEPMFCVVELAGMVNAWLFSADIPLTDFQYASMDEGEPDTLCLNLDGNRTKIYSALQNFEASEPLDTKQVILEFKRFVTDVVALCRRRLELEITDWVAPLDYANQ